MATRAMPITEPRPLRRPRIWDWRLLASLVLILVSIGGILNLLNRADDTRPVLVATRNLPAGAVIGPGDLAEARVAIDDRLYAAAIPGGQAAQTIGKTLTAPAYADQVLVRAQVAGGNGLVGDQVAMTVAVKPEVAVGGRLRAGDEVRVLVTTDKGQPTVATRVVLDRALIYAVGVEEPLRGIGAGSGSDREAGPLASATLILTPEQAEELAKAKWSGEIDIVLRARADGATR